MRPPHSEDPILRSRPPTFGQVGRPPPTGTAWSRGLMLVVAIGVFAALVALVVDLQTRPVRLRTVEVTFMEEEAEAAEASLGQQAPGEEDPAGQAAAEQAAAPTGGSGPPSSRAPSEAGAPAAAGR